MHRPIFYVAIIFCFKVVFCDLAVNECSPNPCGDCEICTVNPNIRCIRAPCPQFECRRNDSCFSAPVIDNGSIPKKELCLLPVESGNCLAYFPKWYFNDTANECKNFVYGGCGGNENKFSTKAECKRICIFGRECPMVKLPAPPQGCRYDKTPDAEGCPSNKLVCDVKPGSCPESTSRTRVDACVIECSTDASCDDEQKCCKLGCNQLCLSPNKPDNSSVPDDDVMFEKSADMPKAKICLLPVEVGKCNQKISKYYFNPSTEECENFTYSGCGGNSNRFSTEEECERICIAGKECQKLKQIPAPDGCRFADESGEDGCPVKTMVCDVKPGLCPKTWNISMDTCTSECDSDNNCDGDSKCCSIECNRLCLKPEIEPAPTSLKGNPGQCPPVASDPNVGVCSNMCSNDDECKGVEKCCQNGCGGFNCLTPIKQGACNLDCIIGKQCAIVNGKATCVDKACNLACMTGKECTFINGKPECVDKSPSSTACNLACEIGKICIIRNGKPECVEKGRSSNCTFQPMPMPPRGCHYSTKTGSDGCPTYELVCNNNTDPCVSNPCNANERCRIAPCFVAPCTEFECLPIHQSRECENNKCLPCQTCIRTPLLCLRAPCQPYFCQNACGECLECGKNGTCMATSNIVNTLCPKDLCKSHSCQKYPEAKCFVDKCNCNRYLYRLPGFKVVTPAECEDI